MTARTPMHFGPQGRPPWQRGLLAAAVAALMGLPGAAYPASLSHLLQLQLEELLRLTIADPVSAPPLVSSARMTPPMPAESRSP